MRKVLRKFCNKLITSLVCGDSRIRTGDPNIANVVLYQLSYIPGKKKAGLVAGSGRGFLRFL